MLFPLTALGHVAELRLPEPVANVDSPIVPASPLAVGLPDCRGVEGPCVRVPRAQDQIWLVNQRCLGCGDPAQLASQLKFHRYDGSTWAPSTLEDFLATDDPSTPTAIYIHGNQIDYGASVSGGWKVYCTLSRRNPNPRAVRFVIWSWPADKVACRPAIDTRTKAARTDGVSFNVAWLADRIATDVRISLIGYSFGSRISAGALHLLAGGSLGCNTLDRVHPDRSPLRAVLLASAMDSDWLLWGHRNGLAPSQVDALLLVNNCCDRALKWYHKMTPGRGGPSALGHTGLYVGGLQADDQEKVAQMNVCNLVGKQHDWSNYVASPQIVARIRPYALFLDSEP